jgi:hypothetical protein
MAASIQQLATYKASQGSSRLQELISSRKRKTTGTAEIKGNRAG